MVDSSHDLQLTILQTQNTNTYNATDDNENAGVGVVKSLRIAEAPAPFFVDLSYITYREKEIIDCDVTRKRLPLVLGLELS